MRKKGTAMVTQDEVREAIDAALKAALQPIRRRLDALEAQLQYLEGEVVAAPMIPTPTVAERLARIEKKMGK